MYSPLNTLAQEPKAVQKTRNLRWTLCCFREMFSKFDPETMLHATVGTSKTTVSASSQYDTPERAFTIRRDNKQQFVGTNLLILDLKPFSVQPRRLVWIYSQFAFLFWKMIKFRLYLHCSFTDYQVKPLSAPFGKGIPQKLQEWDGNVHVQLLILISFSSLFVQSVFLAWAAKLQLFKD